MSYEDARSLFDSVKGYASDSFGLAQGYIDDLHNFIVATIDMVPPTITVDTPVSIVIDPNLSEEKPIAPTSSDFPSIPSSPSVSDFSFPIAPAYSLPTAPSLTDIVVPDFIENTIADVTTSIPTLDFDVPAQPSISDGGDVHQDALMSAALTKLLTNITSGGTMLNATVEDDIWNRDRERSEQALQDAIDKITAQWAKLNFTLPDGLLANQITALQTEYMNKDLDRSRDISIKQAELEQAGMFKSLELAIGLEQVIVGSQNEYAKRVLESSKSTAEITIALFRERVTLYNVQLERFKADVEAYKARIQAEIGRAEVFKTRVMALQTISAIDESKVKVYSAHIAAIEQLVNIYQNEIKAVAVMYEAEKSKIERFKVQVEAYSASIDAVTKKYLAEVEGYKGYIQAWVASSDSQSKFAETNLKAQMVKAEADIKQWEIQMKLVQEETTLKLEALKAVAQTASNVAAGALSAAHASASLSYQNSDSEIHSYSY